MCGKLCSMLAVTGMFLISGCGFPYDFVKVKKEFVKRHIEASEAIEFGYMYFSEHGSWPTEAEVASSNLLPHRWEYGWDGVSEPILMLNGPYHMILYYRFVYCGNKPSSKWGVSCEGDRTMFYSDVPYCSTREGARE